MPLMHAEHPLLQAACEQRFRALQARSDAATAQRLQPQVQSALADARRAYAYEVNAIDEVNLVRQTPQGESIVEFRPFYSLRHGETPEKHGHYWVMRRDEQVAVAIEDIELRRAELQRDRFAQPGAQHALAVGVGQVLRMAPARMVRMAVRHHGPVRGARRVDIEIARRAIQALGALHDQVVRHALSTACRRS